MRCLRPVSRAVFVCVELGTGADWACGLIGRGCELGRIHLDVSIDVRVVSIR